MWLPPLARRRERSKGASKEHGESGLDTREEKGEKDYGDKEMGAKKRKLGEDKTVVGNEKDIERGKEGKGGGEVEEGTISLDDVSPFYLASNFSASSMARLISQLGEELSSISAVCDPTVFSTGSQSRRGAGKGERVRENTSYTASRSSSFPHEREGRGLETGDEGRMSVMERGGRRSRWFGGAESVRERAVDSLGQTARLASLSGVCYQGC